MRITYANKQVRKCFENYGEMKKIIPLTWVRAIKKHVDRLEALNNFGEFLKLDLGHPEPLKGKDKGKYSVRVTGNVRMIIQPDDAGKVVTICEVVRVEGVVDYHGGKETWYIS